MSFSSLVLRLWVLIGFLAGSMASFSFSSSGGNHGRPSFDIGSKQGLTNLYNSPVTQVEHVRRPMGGGLDHSGVVVTTGTGDRWLVHKGKGYGVSGQTVVTDAKHMSSAWSSSGPQGAAPGSRVADYVKAGGLNYNVVTDNCHDASKRMMDVGKGKL